MQIKDYNLIVKQQADGLYRFIIKNIKIDDDAKDIVQDTFVKLWLNRENINPEKVKSWLFTTAYRLMIDKIRKQKRDIGNENTVEPISIDIKQKNIGLKETLEKALDTLPEIQKTLVLLRDYEGYNYQEIGEITGLNESQVKVYIYRARMALKSYLVSTDLII
jgi:RNA polymerase sigma factor (sigma-70 family)